MSQQLIFVKLLRPVPSIFANQFEVVLTEQFLLFIAHDGAGSRIDERKSAVYSGRIDDVRRLRHKRTVPCFGFA